MRLGDLSATAPFRYSNVLFAIVIGMAVFSEFPDVFHMGHALVIGPASMLPTGRPFSAEKLMNRVEVFYVEEDPGEGVPRASKIA